MMLPSADKAECSARRFSSNSTFDASVISLPGFPVTNETLSGARINKSMFSVLSYLNWILRKNGINGVPATVHKTGVLELTSVIYNLDNIHVAAAYLSAC